MQIMPSGPTFTGPVFVLASNKTASAAELAADEFSASGRAKLRETGNRPKTRAGDQRPSGGAVSRALICLKSHWHPQLTAITTTASAIAAYPSGTVAKTYSQVPHQTGVVRLAR